MKKPLKYLIFIALIITASALIVNSWFENESEKLQKILNIEKNSANSIKHAYAAGMVYSFIRKAGMGVELSEQSVIYLGMLNELIEYPVKLGIFSDSGSEIVKDLHNNMVGIEVAKWLEANKAKAESQDISKLIGNLAKHKILILSEHDVSIKNTEEMKIKQFSNVFTAIEWFKEKQNKISEKVNTHLNRNLLHN